MTKKTWKTCINGHRFVKSSDCPVCPRCEEERKPQDGFLSKLAAPARRALERENIKSLSDLARRTENEILNLHGIGPRTIPALKQALSESNLSFTT